MKFSEVSRSVFSVRTLLGQIKKIEHSPTPAELVTISLTSPAIQSVQDHSEFTELAKLVKEQQCKHLLEIGTYKGGTLFVFSQLAAPDAKVISVDCHFTFSGRLYGMLQRPLFPKLLRKGQRLFLVRKNSHQPGTAAMVDRILQGEKLDFLFIDGDHSYEGVQADFNMYVPFVRSGGMVAFHDITKAEGTKKVYKFWEEIKQSYRHKEFIHSNARVPMGIGVLWV